MGKGGARYGAGRPAHKVKGEQLQRLDVRELARKGLLKGTRTFTWSWNRGGEPTGSIGVWVANDALSLRYTTTINGDKRDMVEPVALIAASVNASGSDSGCRCSARYPRCCLPVAAICCPQTSAPGGLSPSLWLPVLKPSWPGMWQKLNGGDLRSSGTWTQTDGQQPPKGDSNSHHLHDNWRPRCGHVNNGMSAWSDNDPASSTSGVPGEWLGHGSKCLSQQGYVNTSTCVCTHQECL